MVCLPCVAVPIVLIIWRFFIQPLIVKWWEYKYGKNGDKTQQVPTLSKECKNGVCTLSWKAQLDALKNERENIQKKTE